MAFNGLKFHLLNQWTLTHNNLHMLRISISIIIYKCAYWEKFSPLSVFTLLKPKAIEPERIRYEGLGEPPTKCCCGPSMPPSDVSAHTSLFTAGVQCLTGHEITFPLCEERSSFQCFTWRQQANTESNCHLN